MDEGPERVLVLEWGPNSLMTDLIKELDHGLSALPYGSEVVFANTHHPDDSLGMVLQNISLENIKVQGLELGPGLCVRVSVRAVLSSPLDTLFHHLFAHLRQQRTCDWKTAIP